MPLIGEICRVSGVLFPYKVSFATLFSHSVLIGESDSLGSLSEYAIRLHTTE